MGLYWQPHHSKAGYGSCSDAGMPIAHSQDTAHASEGMARKSLKESYGSIWRYPKMCSCDACRTHLITAVGTTVVVYLLKADCCHLVSTKHEKSVLHLTLSLLPDHFFLGSPSLWRSSMLAQLRSRPRRLVLHSEQFHRWNLCLLKLSSGKVKLAGCSLYPTRTSSRPDFQVRVVYAELEQWRSSCKWFLANDSSNSTLQSG